MQPQRGTAARRGFTLVEMMVVLGIISLIVAIVLPQLAPVISLAGHEGSARRIAGYGRSAIARAQLLHERMTVKFDLKNQEYWCERWPDPEIVADKKAREQNPDLAGKEPMSPIEALALAKAAEDPESEFAAGDLDKLDAATNEMYTRFDRMARQATIVQSERVHHSTSVLDEVDPLFERGFSLDEDASEEDLAPEEIREPLLSRSRMPSEMTIDSVSVGGERHSGGIVEVEVTPFGLEQAVVIEVANDEGDYYTVEWDPTTGGTRLFEGRDRAR